jgi:6-pyruvoyltetrahydropterin/6-carboxytetrahydropterin synthase
LYEVGVVEHFEAAHSLKGNFGPASRKHGHRYRVEVAVRGTRLAEDGTLFDIGKLGDALRQAISAFHYQDLDEVPSLEGRNTTAEVVAADFLARLQRSIDAADLDSITVRVWESPAAYAAAEARLTARS